MPFADSALLCIVIVYKAEDRIGDRTILFPNRHPCLGFDPLAISGNGCQRAKQENAFEGMVEVEDNRKAAKIKDHAVFFPSNLVDSSYTMIGSPFHCQLPIPNSQQPTSPFAKSHPQVSMVHGQLAIVHYICRQWSEL
jgi:hypothetical protein